jgi:hypothetical protein
MKLRAALVAVAIGAASLLGAPAHASQQHPPNFSAQDLQERKSSLQSIFAQL